MREKKFRQIKRKHQIEKLVVKVLVMVAFALMVSIIGGLVLYMYLLTKCGLL